MSSSSSSSSEESTTAAPPQDTTTVSGDMVDGEHIPPPRKYTLKQAFYKAYSTTPPKHENDMLLTEIPREDKTKLIDYYEYANNPSPNWDKYYTQYHAFEVIVFKKHAAETWDAIVAFFKDNHQLSKRYSKNLSYMLQKQRQCLNSYSTVIRMIVAYPRHRQKNKENAEQFIIDSGLKSHFPIWGVSACKSYAYLSPEEYIKLLNTHAEGCFVSHTYPRFRAFTDEWESSRMTRRRHDDEDDDDDDSSSFTSDGDDCCDGGDDSSTTTTSDDDDMMSCCSSDDGSTVATVAAIDDEKDGPPPPNTTRRFFSPPHPSLAVSSTSFSTNACNSAKLSSPGGSNEDEDDDGTSPVVVADKRPHKKEKQKVRFLQNKSSTMLNRFYRATGFMSHANCGLHKLTVVAKDIHKQTNTLIFHKRSFDRRYEKDIVRSKDYLLPHHHSGGGAPRNNNTNNKRKRNIQQQQQEIETPVVAVATQSPQAPQAPPTVIAHKQQQQHQSKKRKNK